MKVIAFTGMPFAGKSEAVDFAKSLGFPVVRMGDMVWQEVKNQGLNLRSETVGRVANEMRIKKGMDIWAKRTINHINTLNISSKIILDGVRNTEEIVTFKKAFGPDFVLIAIDASDQIRYQRALSRKREDDSSDIKEIIKRDEREIKWGLQKVIQQADYIIKNEGSLRTLQLQINKMLETV